MPRGNCGMGGTRGPICQLQLALLQLLKKTLCQIPSLQAESFSLEELKAPGGPLEQTTATNLPGTELPTPRTTRQLPSLPPPFRKSFLPYGMPSIRLEHRCKWPRWLQISCFILLFVEQNHPSYNSGLEKGGNISST